MQVISISGTILNGLCIEDHCGAEWSSYQASLCAEWNAA